MDIKIKNKKVIISPNDRNKMIKDLYDQHNNSGKMFRQEYLKELNRFDDLELLYSYIKYFLR